MYPPEHGMKVLEVGCGTGTNLTLYHRAGCLVYGIDRSPSMLEVARIKLGDVADLQLGDAANLPYRKDSFDLVLAMFTLHEMPREIRSTVMSEVIRVTKKVGRILIIDFHPNPSRFPKGRFYKAFILLIERGVGREHYLNHRDFLSQKGIPGLVGNEKLMVDNQKIIGAGNIALFLMKRT